MKRKLIVTLVASALELYAATAGAQVAAQCNLVGTATSASGATAVRTGPLNPVDGFPEYVTDSNGVSVQRCLDPAVCFFDPIIQTDPYSLQIGSGGEAFYWDASTVVSNAAGTSQLTVTMAAETAFLQGGPNGEPIDGSQFPFLRLRFVMGVPVDGTYTVVHPYGTDVFTVTGATGARDIFSTVDRGFAPNSTMTGSVGPFLKSTSAPAGYMGDTNATATVTGSPCGRNFVSVTGVDNNGNRVDFGTNEFTLTTNLFAVQGKLFDGKTQTPLAPTRLTYSRSLAGAGQIDSFATSTATATLTVKDGPTIPVGTSKIPLAQTLDRTALSATDAMDSQSVVVADAAALPPIVSLSAADPTAAAPTDATTLNLHLIDFVDISKAEYDVTTQLLTVTAASSDLRSAPTLTLRDFSAFTAGQPKSVLTTAPPGVVHVDSALGGSATAQVRVILAATAPLAPSSLTSGTVTTTAVTLNWLDNSTNENGFRIYTVDAAGVRTLVTTVAANVKTATIAGLTAATSYTFQVDSFNIGGANSSNTVLATTLALPLAPSAVAGTLSTTTRTINVSWVDNSADETGFVVSRATSAAGPFVQIATPAAGATSLVDTIAVANVGSTFFYRVVAARGTDVSTAADSVGLATPALPAAATLLATSNVLSNSVTLGWADNATNEDSYQVFRRTGAGAIAALSGLLPAGTVSFADTTVAAGTSYSYRVDVTNWAGTVASAVSTAVSTPAIVVPLAAPTGLTVTPTTVARPTISWIDNATGETGYRVVRTKSNVNATTGLMTAGTATTLNFAANTRSFREATAANLDIDAGTYTYVVGAVSGTTLGATASVKAVIGTLPAMGLPTTTRSLVGTAPNQTARVRVTWTAPTFSTNVGGYEIQRCAGATCTNFVKVNGTAVNTAGTVDGRTGAASLAFNDDTVARGTAYRYRIRAVGGSGSGLFGAFGGNRAVTTQ
jgi:Fibronectin type III domain